MAKVRLAVIGCGGFVRSHLRAINDHVPEFRLVALCDIVRKRAEGHRKEFFPRKRVGIYTDHKEMLAGWSRWAALPAAATAGAG